MHLLQRKNNTVLSTCKYTFSTIENLYCRAKQHSCRGQDIFHWSYLGNNDGVLNNKYPFPTEREPFSICIKLL